MSSIFSFYFKEKIEVSYQMLVKFGIFICQTEQLDLFEFSINPTKFETW